MEEAIRILVVDDEPDIRRICRILLETGGYTVLEAATGAEALYSDMGHVGRGNIYATWPFVKCCLLLSYMGQGAWLMNNAANPELMGIADLNPFYQMLAPGLRPFAVGLPPSRPSLPRRRSSPAHSRWCPRPAVWISCRTCRSSTLPRPRASSTSPWSTTSCLSAASSWYCCSRTRRIWKPPTALPLR